MIGEEEYIHIIIFILTKKEPTSKHDSIQRDQHPHHLKF